MGITRIVKGTTLAAAILLMGVAAAACGGSGNNTDNLIPQRATLAGSVDLAQALGVIEGYSEQVSDLIPSDSLGGPDGLSNLFDLDQFKAGGLFGDVSRVEIFGEITDSEDAEDPEYFGMLLHGSFDETQLIAELESKSGRDLIQEVYKETNVYSPADDRDEFMLSVLETEIFAVGTGGALHDIIDIMTGDADPASGQLIDVFNEVGNVMFGLAAMVPQDIADGADLSSIPQLSGLPISLDFISALEVVGLGGDLAGDSLNFTMSMDFNNQEAAESLEGFISGIVTLASGFSPDPQTADLLSGLEIDRDGSRLTIKAGIPTTDLFDRLGDLTGDTSNDTFGGTSPGTPEIRLLDSAVGDEIAIMPSAFHVDEGQKVEYSTTPPTSGDHWARWADCGWYPDGLPDEVITHNLEHSNVVVSYNFTNPAQVTELRQALEATGSFAAWGVARSYGQIPDGQVALSAWGRLATHQGVKAVEIARFFDTFAGETGPELIPC